MCILKVLQAGKKRLEFRLKCYKYLEENWMLLAELKMAMRSHDLNVVQDTVSRAYKVGRHGSIQCVGSSTLVFISKTIET